MSESAGFSLSNPAILFGLFNLAAYVVTIAIAFTKLGGRQDVMSARLKNIETDMHDLKTTDRRLSVIEERQTNHARMQTQLMDEIQHLRKGEGFIQSRRSSVDGEYS